MKRPSPLNAEAETSLHVPTTLSRLWVSGPAGTGSASAASAKGRPTTIAANTFRRIDDLLSGSVRGGYHEIAKLAPLTESGEGTVHPLLNGLVREMASPPGIADVYQVSVFGDARSWPAPATRCENS